VKQSTEIVEAAPARDWPSPLADAPVVIEARDIDKTFRIPQHRVDSLKERATHPFRRIEYRELRALRGVSFDVHKGEFFGIVGRNGSGKSSLLKILASIYKADAGEIYMGGRLAPFIELGVGFNPELTARENVVLNGVMMGLSRREAARRLDSVLDFAELQDFVELKLKNYSSGMMVRLAFAVMVQADADIMLIDEVLAVGDASFAQKCMDVFHEKRRDGKTIVLVTHDMATVQSLCHRAMLIHDGELRYIGDPEETARRYYRLNFARGEVGTVAATGGVPDVHARVVEAALKNRAGEPVENIEQGEPIGFSMVVEAMEELSRTVFAFHLVNADGVHVFGFNRTLTLEEGEEDRIAAGERARIAGLIDNPLVPGRYSLLCWICRNRNQGDVALQTVRLFDFVVYGAHPGPGMISVQADVRATLEPGDE
jgi:ABC-type polysaccharide/polyol phosphate transport system ATPase subunit